MVMFRWSWLHRPISPRTTQYLTNYFHHVLYIPIFNATQSSGIEKIKKIHSKGKPTSVKFKKGTTTTPRNDSTPDVYDNENNIDESSDISRE